MFSIASALADSIKPQVLMMMMSASAGAVLDEGVAENVGVHLVFGAAEGDDRNLHRTSFIYSMFLRCQSSASAARMTLWLNPRRASAAATWSRLPAASLAA